MKTATQFVCPLCRTFGPCPVRNSASSKRAKRRTRECAACGGKFATVELPVARWARSKELRARMSVPVLPYREVVDAG